MHLFFLAYSLNAIINTFGINILPDITESCYATKIISYCYCSFTCSRLLILNITACHFIKWNWKHQTSINTIDFIRLSHEEGNVTVLWITGLEVLNIHGECCVEMSDKKVWGSAKANGRRKKTNGSSVLTAVV